MKNLLVLCCVLLLAACGGVSSVRPGSADNTPIRDTGNNIFIYSLGLIDTNYRFRSKNLEAELDCSGMVWYVYQQAAGLRVSGSAADIARQGRPISKAQLRAGDLVFFNTMHRPFFHVGIYIGDGRFINAPSTNGKVRIGRLDKQLLRGVV